MKISACEKLYGETSCECKVPGVSEPDEDVIKAECELSEKFPVSKFEFEIADEVPDTNAFDSEEVKLMKMMVLEDLQTSS